MVVLVAGVTFNLSVSLAQSDSLSPETQAKMLTKLWLDTCAKHFVDSEQIRDVAKTSRFHMNPPYAKALLGKEKGTVWDVCIGPLAQMALILFDDGKCQVRGRRADSKIINTVFERVLKGVNTPGVTVLRVFERDIEPSGVPLKQIAYFVARTGEDQGNYIRFGGGCLPSDYHSRT